MSRNRQTVLRALACLAACLAATACDDDRTPPVAPEQAEQPLDTGLALGVTAPFNNSAQCMEQDIDNLSNANNITPSCTANDIRIANATAQNVVNGQPVSGGATCTPNTNVTLRVTAHLEATSTSDREDIGAWIATDGGNARVGACNHYNLVNGSANTINTDQDACAGMSAAGDPNPKADLFLGDITIPCNVVIQNNQTFIQVGSCLTWKVPGQNELCPTGYTGPQGTYSSNAFRQATLPGTPAKCNCEPFLIPVTVVGQLTITKNAIPDHPQDFAYTTTGAGLSNFSLDDDAASATPSNTTTFQNLVNDPAITRTVTETVPTGWTLTNIACTGATQSTVSIGSDGDFDAGDTQVSVVLKAGEHVSCTYTNTASASLDIEKQTLGGTATFSYTTSGTGLAAFSRNTATNNPTQSTPFSFTGADVTGDKYVSETALAGWTLTDIQCTAGGATIAIGTGQGASFVGDGDFDAGDNTVKVTLAPGGSPSCTFVNTASATLDIEKQTLGGTATFSYTTSGTGLAAFSRNTATNNPTQSTPFSLTGADVTGDKYVTETALAGWTLTDIQCTAGGATIAIGTGVGAGFSGDGDFDAGDNTVKVTVDAGDTPSCTFVNSKHASLAIQKQTLGGTATFSYTTSGTGLAAFTRNTATNNPTTEAAFALGVQFGDKYVTETALAGWTLTDIQCTAGGATIAIGTGVGAGFSGDGDFDAGDNTVKATVDAGDTPSCTFVNSATATLDIEKETIGGAGTFSYAVSGTGLAAFSRNTATNNPTQSTPFSFTGTNVTGDKYVTETVPAGWALTNITCTAGGATIAIGTGQGASFVGDGDFDAGDNTVKVTLAPGSSPSCTFRNEIPTIGRITPTQTTCFDFKTAPNAAANTLEFINYSRRGNRISQVDPGVFFYYSEIKHQGGNLTVTTNQVPSPAFTRFLVHNYPATSQVNLYDANCSTIGGAQVAFLEGGTRVQVTLPSAATATYYLGIKFDPGTVVGATISAGTQIVYTFTTSVNGGAAINGDNLTLRPKP